MWPLDGMGVLVRVVEDEDEDAPRSLPPSIPTYTERPLRKPYHTVCVSCIHTTGVNSLSVRTLTALVYLIEYASLPGSRWGTYQPSPDVGVSGSPPDADTHTPPP